MEIRSYPLKQSGSRPKHAGTLKALFIHATPDKSLEDIQQIAKKEALRIGFKDKQLIRVRYAQYLPQLEGWIVVVQNLW